MLRGGGDIATGVCQKLWRAGFRVVILETAVPMAIRRTVSLCTAVNDGSATVEDMTARLVAAPKECSDVWNAGEIPVLIDPTAENLHEIGPDFLVDAILAKRNLGTHKSMAQVVFALGPGFTAPRDAHAVIETMRGHNLGRLILDGEALPNTGIPGIVGGEGAKRVIHAPLAGVVRHIRRIGDGVKQGEAIFAIGDTEVPSPLDGTLRGLIAEGITVEKGLKCADVDPREQGEVDCHSISDKARCIGGAVLEACMYFGRLKNL